MSGEVSSPGSTKFSGQPGSPRSPATNRPEKRRRTSVSQPKGLKEGIGLPPPPTRARRIIQMGPQQKEQKTKQSSPSQAKEANKTPTLGSAGGKEVPNPTGTSGRKTAQHTAHSIIESRRRSKMKEEFDTLQDMIPACKGHKMHKLSVLQASIEYLRYLERCVSDLQEKSRTSSGSNQEVSQSPRGAFPASVARKPSPTVHAEVPQQPKPHSSNKPGTTATESSRSPSKEHHPSPVHATTQCCYSRPSVSASDTTTPMTSPTPHASICAPKCISPALLPQPTLEVDDRNDSHRRLGSHEHETEHDHPDHEATEATEVLLMLNMDCRGSKREGGALGNTRGGGGISVKDLLCTS